MDTYPKDKIDPVKEYRTDIQTLLRYLPWMEEHRSKQVVSEYQGEAGQPQNFSFPVYDSTLLGFVKAAQKTKLMDRNYPYVYSRNRIRTFQDELRVIRNAKPKDIDNLRGILSKYVMGGMTKGSVWPEAVSNGIFAEVLEKLGKFIG